MTTVNIKGHVYELRFDQADAPQYVVFNSDKMADRFCTYVGPVDIAYTIPADYNPTAAKLAELAKRREAACKLFADSVREIDEQIGKLQALTCDGVAA